MLRSQATCLWMHMYIILEFVNFDRCVYHRRRQEGNTGNVPPPEMEKNCCRKMMVFPKALFLATTFPKIDKNSIFLLKICQTSSKFSQNFPPICIFRSNARKINAGFLKFC